MLSVSEENIALNGLYFNLDNIILPLVCSTVVIACLVNEFLTSSNSPTLYDDVSNWPFEFIKNIIFTYALFLCSIMITVSSVMVFFSHQATLIAELREQPQRYFLWNYIFLEIGLKAIDRLSYYNHHKRQIFFYFVWCAMFAPSICLFDQRIVTLAFQETFLIMCALTAVAFFWNLSIQKYLMRKLVSVFIGSYILLTVITIIVIVFGFPRNIFGLSLVIFAVYGGFVMHIFLFVISTHVFVELTRRGMEDMTHSAIDLFVCTMHIFGRIMIVNSYTFVALKS